jgi:succinyl-diaminopimelate desuccinylase
VPPVTLLFVSDEETGSELGLQHVLENHPELFREDDIILVPDGGNPEGDGIEIAEKSVLWLRFTVTGRQTHGSTPQEGINAFRAACRLASRLDEELHERFDDENDLYDPPESTFEPTLHESNVPNVNTVPGQDTFCFDCRVLPHADLDDVLHCAREECDAVDGEMGTQTEIEILNRLDAPEPTSPDAPAVRLLSSVLRDVRGIDADTRGIGGSTVAAHFRRHGYPAVVWSTVNATMHQANEHCKIQNMVDDSRVFAGLFATDFEGV